MKTDNTKATDLNPDFSELTEPATIINEIEDLERRRLEEQNPFPVEAFPKDIQHIITAANESLTFPTDFTGASILYALSVCIGNTYKARVMKEYKQNAVIYVALVGRPGTNKSHPISFILKPIEDRDNLAFQKYQHKKTEFEADSALTPSERRQQGLDEPIKPIWEQHLVTDFTPEALTEVHKHNNRGVGVYADELASWFKNFNRYNKGSEEQFWLSVWSGKPIRINRKTSEPVYIPLPFIPVIGTIQPGIINELAYNRIENGFLDRLLFVYPDRLKKEYWSDKELSPAVAERWQSIVEKLLDLKMSQDETGNIQPIALDFEHDARQALFDWQKELTDQSNKPENEAISGINAKIEMYAIRLALLLQMAMYACNEGSAQAIGIDAVRGALQLVEYFKRTAIKVHTMVTSQSPIDRLPTDKQNIYAALPDTFATGQGVQIAESLKMPERTFKRFIGEKELFERVNHGEYRKLF